MRDQYVKKVIEVAYHRNGISGAPFHVVRFTSEEGGVEHEMIGVVFDTELHVAVFDFQKLADGNVKFLENSWRGDRFEPELRDAIEKDRIGLG